MAGNGLADLERRILRWKRRRGLWKVSAVVAKLEWIFENMKGGYR